MVLTLEIQARWWLRPALFMAVLCGLNRERVVSMIFKYGVRVVAV
jgi:hypothetical protein